MRSLRRELASQDATTIEEAIEMYVRFLRDVKQNRVSSVATTRARLEAFFPDREMPLRALDRATCSDCYDALCRTNAVDTHRNSLAEARTFGAWCEARKLVERNPLAGIEGVGRRRKGKPQLRIDEARKWITKAFELADMGEAGAVAAAVALYMGLRASEITSRVVRDLDDGSRLLWIDHAKTEAGRRAVQVPEVLRPHLQRLASAKGPEDRLFGEHRREWVRGWVNRLCKLADVPVVSTHSLRGLHSTLAEEAGVSAHAVARALGHESVATTHEHYTAPAAVANAKQRRVLRVLDGGGR
ncbi:MAG: tyrosine-type recombinase/integrase [Deltaproteobacteria bacterium]|nr:tyrosine-type recombinase/integrase [Deltaproteobacteria bacterium]